MTNLSGERRKKLMDKIRHLFNLADRAVDSSKDTASVDHEAQLALETARKLLLQYGIDEAAVRDNIPESDGSGGHTVKIKSSTVGTWSKRLAIIVANYFCVKTVYAPHPGMNQTLFLFFGVSTATEPAALAFESCHYQIRTLSRKYKVNKALYEAHPHKFIFGTFSKYRDAAKSEYRSGILMGLTNRLTEIKKWEDAATTALVLAYGSAADKFIESNNLVVKDTKPPRRQALGSMVLTGGGHYLAGIKDSVDVSIVSGLSEESSCSKGY
jgi:hypothetical protein